MECYYYQINLSDKNVKTFRENLQMYLNFWYSIKIYASSSFLIILQETKHLPI